MFYARTQASFEAHLHKLVEGQGGGVPQVWLTVLRNCDLGLFDAEVMPGLADLPEPRRQLAVSARKGLLSTFNGRGGSGVKIYKALDLKSPKSDHAAKAEANT